MLRDSNQIQNKSKLITRRMFILSVVKAVVFFSIVGRLFHLQISKNIKYTSLSNKNRLREWKVAPQRGIIKDYFGEKIATNTQVFQLHLIPEDVPNLDTFFFKLSKLISFDKNDEAKLIKKIKKRKPWEPVIVSENLTWSEFSKLNVFLHEIQGIKPVVSVARKYSNDGTSSHIVGYVGDMSVKDLENSKLLREINVPGLQTGKNGLEKSFNKEMIGQPGLQRFEVNAYGKKIKELKFINGIAGQDLKITIDQEVQKFTNKLLEGVSGSVCVMDIYTGEVVSMVSSPTYDANKFVHGISKEDWKELLDNERKPLINKPLSGLYPPGSAIKPIVALSALENDVVSPKFVLQCKGTIELYGRKYHCWKNKGHGYVNLREGIKQSCDIYFYEAARRLGIDRLSITSKKFGLGKKVFNIFNEERSGIVPDTKWKLKTIGKGWVLGETLISGIGQGYFQSSPIQLCLMMAQLANGGFEIKPRIINDKYDLMPTINAWRKEFTLRKQNLNERNNNEIIATSDKSENLKSLFKNKENIKFVLDALYGATNEPMGTSYRSRNKQLEYIFAGKTGTSQVKKFTEEQRKLKVKNKDLPYKSRDHSLFVGFAPYNKPRYAISVVIEHGGTGSSVAAPIAKKVITKVLTRHNLRNKNQLDLFQEV